MSQTRRDNLFDLAVLAATLIIFFSVSFYQIRLPGLYYDEAVDVFPAMQIVQGDPGRLDMAQRAKIGPIQIPVMVMVYVGAVSTYAALPFYWLFGPGVESTRAMTIVMAGIGLVFAYYFLKELLDRRVAALTVLLAAVHPAFVLWSRMGIYVSSPMLTMATGSLLCLLRWRQRRRTGYLYAAAFLMGLGLSTKILFLWFILAVFGAALLLGRLPRLRTGRWTVGQDAAAPELNLRQGLLSLAAFAAGAWMIIVYNLTTHNTLRYMLNHAISTDAGVNNLDIVHNLTQEVHALIEMLDGSWFQGVWGPAFRNSFFPIVFFASVAVLLAVLWRGNLPWARRRVTFVLLFIGFIWLQSGFTITGLGATHLYILYPFPQAVIGMAALALWPRMRLRPLLAVLIVVVFVSDAWAVRDHQTAIARSGGNGFFSDSIYELAADLESSGGAVAAADWGFRYNVGVITQGRVRPVEVFSANMKAPQADFAKNITPYLERSDSLILFHPAQLTAYQGRLEEATRLAAAMQRKLVLVRTYAQRNGRAVALLYRTEPLAP